MISAYCVHGPNLLTFCALVDDSITGKWSEWDTGR
jgi:hypothetical protein